MNLFLTRNTIALYYTEGEGRGGGGGGGGEGGSRRKKRMRRKRGGGIETDVRDDNIEKCLKEDKKELADLMWKELKRKRRER